jgi:mannose-1-phosphate guanylyltransferase
VWPNGWIGPGASLHGAILGRNCHVGRSTVIESAAVLGDKTVLTDYSRL